VLRPFQVVIQMFCCKLTVATGPLEIFLLFRFVLLLSSRNPPSLSETTAWLASKNAIFSNGASSLSPPLERAVFSPIHSHSSLGPCWKYDGQRFESHSSTTSKTTGISSFNTQSKDAFLGLLVDRDRPLSRLKVSLLQPPCLPSLFFHLILRIKSGGSRTGISANRKSMTLRVICRNLSNQKTSLSESRA